MMFGAGAEEAYLVSEYRVLKSVAPHERPGQIVEQTVHVDDEGMKVDLGII
jgi:hypothetical protein